MRGLELDRRNDSPIPLHKPDEREKYAYYRQSSGAQTSRAPVPLESDPRSRRFCALRPTTLILSVAPAGVAVLAVVAAGAGGSQAAKRRHLAYDHTLYVCSGDI